MMTNTMGGMMEGDILHGEMAGGSRQKSHVFLTIALTIRSRGMQGKFSTISFVLTFSRCIHSFFPGGVAQMTGGVICKSKPLVSQ